MHCPLGDNPEASKFSEINLIEIKLPEGGFFKESSFFLMVEYD